MEFLWPSTFWQKVLKTTCFCDGDQLMFKYFDKSFSINAACHYIHKWELRLFYTQQKWYVNGVQKRCWRLWLELNWNWTHGHWKLYCGLTIQTFWLFMEIMNIVFLEWKKKNNVCFQHDVQKWGSVMIWGGISGCLEHLWKKSVNESRKMLN